jgi:putative DNA primase/helicase
MTIINSASLAVKSPFALHVFTTPPAPLGTLRWCMWRYVPDPKGGKSKKRPYHPNHRALSIHRLYEWTTYPVAAAIYPVTRWDGIGFRVRPSDHLVVVDFDGSTTDPRIAALDSYTELSPSGTGVHVILHVPDARRLANDFGGGQIFNDWFITYTGNLLPGAPPTIRTIAYTELAAMFHLPAEGNPPPPPARTAPPPPSADLAAYLDTILYNWDGRWACLWDGAWEAFGYPSQSEADGALIYLLLNLTGDDPAATAALFKRSGLYRPIKGERYVEHTIQTALRKRGKS